ncbi:MAG: ATP-binding cassette domain-containing protein [Lachnospiraceae bacterium]|nr:ATP-binding cassette domain-containing protein [Lachnospiraceae bacterium]
MFLNNQKLRKAIILAGWLLLWQLLCLWVDNDILLVGPVATCKALLAQGVTMSFWVTIFWSLLRIAVGFFAGVFMGLVLAFLSARFLIIEEILSPIMTLMKAIPVASFVVLFLIWWSSSVLSIAISFMVVLPNIYLNTVAGIKSADKRLLEMSRVHRMSGRDVFFYIYRDALRPFWDSAIKLSVGMSWKSGVAAEVIGTPDFSIGEALYMSKIHLDTAGVLAWTIVTVLMSLAFEKAVLAGWEAFAKWQPKCRGAKYVIADKKVAGVLVQLEQIGKSYAGKTVLTDISQEYEYGKTYYFRTPSGSGKSTLFRMIAGLECQDMGILKRQTEAVSMAFQEDRLCENYNALVNVSMVTGEEARAREHLLELLMPEDIEKPCRELSGGMKRRVAIARAMAARSDLVILDEPFVALDEENRRRVQHYIEQYKAGRTLLIATHIE